MPFLKFCPKPKRALRISSPYLAKPVQKAYQRVFASMELLKIVLTFYPRESNNYPANSQCLPAKNTLDATYFKLHLKCWINMCLFNTLDADVLGVGSVYISVKSKAISVHKFRHALALTIFIPTPFWRKHHISPLPGRQMRCFPGAFCGAPFFICRNKKVAEIQIKSPAPIYRMHCKDG